MAAAAPGPDPPVLGVQERIRRVRECLDCRAVRKAVSDCARLRVDGLRSRRSKRARGASRACRVVQKQTTVYGGRDAPEPLVAECTTWAEQLAGAARARHPVQDWAEDLGEAVDDAVEYVASALAEGRNIARERAQKMKVIRAVKQKLVPVNQKIDAWVPEHIKGMVQRMDVALVHVLSTVAGSPDTDLPVMLAVGMEAVGDVPDSGWWPLDEKPALVGLDELDHAEWHRRMEANIRREAGQPWRAADVAAVWEKTIGECARGLMHGPFTRAQLDECYGEGAWRAMQRFGVWQKGKLRACDNARTSLHNEATACHERMVLEGPDFPARVAMAFSAAAARLGVGPWELLSGTDDLADAYRHIPTRSPQWTVVALWSPEEQAVRYFTLPGFNFGLKAAVPQFNRVAEATTLVANALLGVCCAHFFDDFNVTEPAQSARSGQAELGELHRLLGLPFSAEKHKPAAAVVVFLGVQTDLSEAVTQGKVSMRVTEERLLKLGAIIEEILDADELPPAVAASLVGKLQFTLSWAFGRVGRAALQPLHAEMAVHREGWVAGARIRLVNRREQGFEWRPSDVDIESGELANPFPMGQGDGRDEVCDALHKLVFEGGSVDEVRQSMGLHAAPVRRADVRPALRALKRRAERGLPFRMVCSCLPRRCHGLTYLQYLGAAPRRAPSGLTEGQRAALRFFADVLPELKPHVVRLRPASEAPALIFSDARYEEDDPSGAPAAVGFVVAIPREGAPPEGPARGGELAFLAEHYEWSHGSAYVPEEIMQALVQRKQQIGQAEILGGLVPYLSMPRQLQGRDVLHWIDNTSAKAALVHGYSGRPDSARIVHLFHAWNMGLGARAWFEYVPSPANPADEPSRIDISRERFRICAQPEIVSEPVPVVFPPVERWSDPAGWARQAAAMR